MDVEDVSQSSGDVIRMPCRALSNATGGLCRGCLMLVSYPPDGRCHEHIYLPVALMIATERLKAAVVSFRMSSSEIRHVMTYALKRVGLGEHLASELVIHAVGINPTALGLEDILDACEDTLRNHCPDMLILHGVEILDFLYGGSGRLISTLYNLVMRAKLMGSSVVVLYGRTRGGTYEALSALSSIVFRLEYVREGNTVKPQLYVWGSGNVARVLSADELRRCIEEGIESLNTLREPTQSSKGILEWWKKG